MSATLSRPEVDIDGQANGCFSEFVSSGLGSERTLLLVYLAIARESFGRCQIELENTPRCCDAITSGRDLDQNEGVEKRAG